MDEKTTKTVGIDIGGTSIKMGLVTERGEVLATSKVSTGALNSDGAFAKVCEGVHALAEQGGIDASELDAIGLDVPGVVLEDGTLTMAPNITLDLAGLTTTLREAYPQASLAVLNDANAAALGEAWLCFPEQKSPPEGSFQERQPHATAEPSTAGRGCRSAPTRR